MNSEKTSRDHLEQVLSRIIDGHPEDAEINFHEYVAVKAKEVVGDDKKQVSNEE